MAGIVYLLCAATSLTCSILLLRGYKNSGVRLLLWSGLCFIGLALNNLLLFVDREMLSEGNLFVLRSVPALIGLMLLLYGLVWEDRA